MRRFVAGLVLGVALTLSGVISLAAWSVHVVRRQTAALQNAYASLASSSGAVWDRLTPETRSWLMNRAWSDLRRCAVVDIDIETSTVDTRCGEAQLRIGFSYDCDPSALFSFLRWFKLASCTDFPQLVDISVKRPPSEWITVFSGGEPLID